MRMFSLSRGLTGFAAATATVAVVSMTAAVASPPTPLLTKLDDVARAQVVDGGTIGAPAGTDLTSALYTLPAGTGTGWRSTAGTSALAVTKGTLTLQSAAGCTTKEYKAGQAAIVPPGRFQIANGASAPLEFAGVFAKLAKSAGDPLTNGAGVAAPATCKGSAQYTAASTSAAGAVETARGTMVPLSAYGQSLHAMGAKGITVEAGKDMMVASYRFLPGFSSGWITHVPALGIVTRGSLTYYEGRDGTCVKSEQYGPGQAYTHVGAE